MAAGKATPPLKSNNLSIGTVPIFIQSQSHLISKPVELPFSYSTVVQNTHLRQPSPSTLTETHTPLNVWIEDDPELLKPFSIIQGKPSFEYSTAEKNALVQKVNKVLIGKFSHGRPSMASIKEFFTGLKLQGDYNISSLDSKHIYIECKKNQDFYKIWLNLVWNINGYAMRVFKWSIEFNPERESSVAPVWIRLENLPLYLFDKLTLSSLSSAVGKPICIDHRNLNRSLLSYALVCVELDVSKPLVESIWIGFKEEKNGDSFKGLWVKVSYGAVPHFCSICNHLGHSSERCKSKLNSALAETKFTHKEVEKHLGKSPMSKADLLSHCPAECNMVKRLVMTTETNCKPLQFWKPIGKPLSSSAKDYTLSVHNQPLVMNNRFKLLDKQQLPSVVSKFSNQPATVQDAEPVLDDNAVLYGMSDKHQTDQTDKAYLDEGSAAKDKAATNQLATSGDKQIVQEVPSEVAPLLDAVQAFKGSNSAVAQITAIQSGIGSFESAEGTVTQLPPVSSGKSSSIQGQSKVSSVIHTSASTEILAAPQSGAGTVATEENTVIHTAPGIYEQSGAATLHQNPGNRKEAAYQARHSEESSIQASQSNKLSVEMAAVASSSYAEQLSDIPGVTSQAFSLNEAAILRSQNQSEQTERAVHEITKKQVQEPDFRSDQVGHQKRSNEQSVVDFTKMTTSEIRSYTDQQCKEMIKDMKSDPGLLFSSTTHLTLAQLKSDFANRYLDSDNAYDCLGLSDADDSQYEEMDEDEVLQYEEELANHFCDELDKKQKKKNRLYASPPTFRVGMLR